MKILEHLGCDWLAKGKEKVQKKLVSRFFETIKRNFKKNKHHNYRKDDST